MLDWLTPDNEAIAMLKKDHDTVKALFDQFEASGDKKVRTKIIEEAIEELKIHAAIEEELFYPAVRKAVGTDVMNEADEEHHVVKLLVAELENKGDDDHRDAKFTVLAENVRHHIKEEEAEMLPKAREASVDFDKLSAEMQKKKEQLKMRGVPPAAEEKLIANNRKSDSPAATARRKATHASGRSAVARKRTRTASGK